MDKFPKDTMKRSKSVCSLEYEECDIDLRAYKEKREYGYNRTSESSVEVYVVNESDTDESDDGRAKQLEDSGIGDRVCDDAFVVLEQKIDRLNDLFLEQSSLLTTIKKEIRESNAAVERSEQVFNHFLTDTLKTTLAQCSVKQLEAGESSEAGVNSRAKSLLDAIEFRQGFSLDREIKEVLVNVLQSDDLKDRMVSATMKSMAGVIRECFSRDVSTIYIPVLERSHRRLVKQVTRTLDDVFAELEENSVLISKSMYKTSRSLRRVLERHQSLLEDAVEPTKRLISSLQYTVEDVVKKELQQWRQKVLDVMSEHLVSNALPERGSPTPPPSIDYTPISPPQPADPEQSIIDQLMMSAVINKQMNDGDVNGSFAKALSAGDLALVMTACRAADPGEVFAPPCSLDQSVLLSLVQQLATDMVHETQLKCRYLEEAIINLNKSSPATRAHLPLVIGEVRKHLTKFLTSYPSHVANRRITLIVMAADNLLK